MQCTKSLFFLINFVNENIKKTSKVGYLSTFEEISVQPKRPDLPKNKKVQGSFELFEHFSL